MCSWGSTDPFKLTLPVMHYLNEHHPSLRQQVVITRSTPDSDQIRVFASSHENICITEEPATLAYGLAEAEFAIGAPGTTTWQRLVCGCKTGIISTNTNQISLVQALSEKNLLCYLGHGADQESTFCNLSEFISDFSSQSSACIDTQGVSRILSEIMMRSDNSDKEIL